MTPLAVIGLCLICLGLLIEVRQLNRRVQRLEEYIVKRDAGLEGLQHHRLF